jgi:hypothetical protein
MGTVPTPLDWIAADGTFITAAIGQAGVGDPLDFLLDPPGAQVRRTTAQSIPNSTPTAIQFDAEDSDNDGMHSTVTNTSRLTCVTPGRFLVFGSIPYDTGTTGTREARIVKNGSGTSVSGGRFLISAPGGASMVALVGPIEVALIAGDFLELFANQSNGTSLTTTAINGIFPLFRARWCGP